MEIPAKLYSLTATQVICLIERNTINVEQYACALLNRIEERDSIVKAWEYLGSLLSCRKITDGSYSDDDLDKEVVLSQARSLDQIPHAQRGPLHGAAIAIKDIMDTKGAIRCYHCSSHGLINLDMPTQYGSAFYKENQPNCDASVVAMLRNAGALIFGAFVLWRSGSTLNLFAGKSTTTEFTILNSGPKTTNPHDPNRTPGGSSAGSAAAVADFQVPLSVGTQTGGSVIRPASFTGIFSIKTSWNKIALGGIKPVAPTLDSFGVFACSIDDLQLVVDALAPGDNGLSRTISLKETRLALVKSPMWPAAGPGTIEAMEKAASIL